MDPQRTRILADLGGLLRGSVHCDALTLQLYSTDASIYEIRPIAVVRPAHEADVVAVVKYAEENQLAVHARGAGSSVTGASLGAGIVLDMTGAMRRIQSVSDNVVTVGPGVTLAALNEHLGRTGRHFGPDPATRSVTTLGGVVATGAVGSHWAKYGGPREKVLALRSVMADGSTLEIDSRLSANFRSNYRPSPWHEQVQHLLRRYQNVIARHHSDAPVDASGYYLHDLMHGDLIDLTRLFVGSEGTLGIITELTLLTDAKPAHRGVVLLFFDRIESAIAATDIIARLSPVACDLLDRRLLSLARELEPRYRRVIPAPAEAMLIVEFDSDDISVVQDRLTATRSKLDGVEGGAFASCATSEKTERDFYWHLARRIAPILYRLKGNERAIPLTEDIAIAPTALQDFISGAHEILNRFEVTASFSACTLQGTVDIRPFLDITNPKHVQKISHLATEIFDLARRLGGSISGGSSNGLSRTWYLSSHLGEMYDVYRDVKRAFDPDFRLNPGKIVNYPFFEPTDNLRQIGLSPEVKFIEPPAEATTDANASVDVLDSMHEDHSSRDDSMVSGGVIDLHDQSDSVARQGSTAGRLEQTRSPDLAISTENSVADNSDPNRDTKPDTRALPVFEPQLHWTSAQIAQTARACNGCARCRTTGDIERMCPIFRVLPTEEASPRAKANLMRGILSGAMSPDELTSDETKSIADLCVNCHQCRVECPASVNIPRLVTEIKAQHVDRTGIPFSQRLLTHLETVYWFGSRLPLLSNWTVSTPWMRWLLDRCFGIAAGRKLPPFAKRTFLAWAKSRHAGSANRVSARRSLKSLTRRVVYFVDGLANYNDPEIGRALVAVMEHNGVEVFVPQGQRISGMSLISDGLVARARRHAARNVEVLADAVRQGYQVVTTEPSAMLALRHDYESLLDDADAQLIAENTMDAFQYLWELHLTGQLELDFQPINAVVGYHTPCHLRAVYPESPAMKVLKLIPGLTVQHLDKGCSGMAGLYGLKRQNYRRSLRAGVGLINALRNPEIVSGVTDCGTCKMQMEQGTVKPTVHPVKILARAYNLNPELADLFNRRGSDRVLST